jgi:hypothetical protein
MYTLCYYNALQIMHLCTTRQIELKMQYTNIKNVIYHILRSFKT